MISISALGKYSCVLCVCVQINGDVIRAVKCAKFGWTKCGARMGETVNADRLLVRKRIG